MFIHVSGILLRFLYCFVSNTQKIPSAFCQALPFAMFVHRRMLQVLKGGQIEYIEFGLELAVGKLTLNMFVYLLLFVVVVLLLLLSLSLLLLLELLLLLLIMYMYKYLLQLNNNIYIYTMQKNHTSHGGINLSTSFFVWRNPPKTCKCWCFLTC